MLSVFISTCFFKIFLLLLQIVHLLLYFGVKLILNCKYVFNEYMFQLIFICGMVVNFISAISDFHRSTTNQWIAKMPGSWWHSDWSRSFSISPWNLSLQGAVFIIRKSFIDIGKNSCVKYFSGAYFIFTSGPQSCICDK